MDLAVPRSLFQENILSNHKSILVPLVLLLAFYEAPANSVTLAELAKKNNQVIELDADLAIARKKAELEKLKPAPIVNLTPKPEKKSPTADLDGVTLNSIFGDPASPSGKFDVNGFKLTRRRGDSVNGWIIAQIAADSATLFKPQKDPKDKPISKTIYLTGNASPQLAAGRDALRPPLPLPISNIPFPATTRNR